MGVEEADGVGVEAEAAGLFAHRRVSSGEIGVGVDEHLQIGQRGGLLVAQAQACERGQRAARAVAGDRHPTIVVEYGGRRCRPVQHGNRVVDRCRPRVLGREPVVDGKHACRGASREPPAGAIVGVEAADRPTAAVEVDDHGKRAGERTVEAAVEVLDPQLPAPPASPGRAYAYGRVERSLF